MTNFFKSIVVAATMALGALGLGALPAAAATITSTSATVAQADEGTSFEVNFICSAAVPCSGTPYSVLQARATMDFLHFWTDGTNNYWQFSLTLFNNSYFDAGGFLTGFGFATDPDAVVDDFWQANTDGINWVVGEGSIPGFSLTELCVWNGKNCQSASNHDLTPATGDTVNFILMTGLNTTLTLSDFAVKWAGNAVTGGSFEAGGTIKVAPVPLPAAGGLLLLGLGGLALLRRKRNAA